MLTATSVFNGAGMLFYAKLYKDEYEIYMSNIKNYFITKNI